jgi:hypothetical protein
MTEDDARCHEPRRRFESLLKGFESTVQEARDARDAVVGSFDVLIARDGRRTNEIIAGSTAQSAAFSLPRRSRRPTGHKEQLAQSFDV